MDNTNVKYWEIKHYLNIASQNNYIVFLIEPRTPHKFNAQKLYGKVKINKLEIS